MKKLHLICNAHLDPIWQWEWEEGAAAALSTFQSAVNLSKQFDYVFCHNEVTLYKYVENYAPKLFEEIKELVKQGKWHIMGGWYLQSECLMPEGEGIVRQIREGELYFEKKFGVKPTTAVNMDPFGHSRGLVQIMSKCGQDSYMFMRPYGPHIRKQLDLPEECFLWEGYDGSRIKAVRLTEYNSDLGHAREKIEKDIERRKDEELSISPWGVGNHGGGPSAKDLSDIADFMKTSEIEIVHSTPERFFAEAQPTKVFTESLISCMVGCYTSMIGVKQKYRQLEKAFYFTEKMSSIAALKGVVEYPDKKLREVTEDMLNVQFHDILPGTCIKEGEDNALTYINHGLHELNLLRAKAMFGLCKGQPVAEENTYPIMVFNPKTYVGKQTVECELSIIPTDCFENSFSQIEIYDVDGQKIPAQTVKEGSSISIDWRKKVVFEAELKPLSVTRFTAKTVVLSKPEYPVNEDIVFDNGEKRVVINAKTGLIESYIVDDVEYAKGAFFAPYAYEDYPDPWGMNYTEVGRAPKPFAHLENPDGVFKGLQSFEIIEDGALYTEAETFFAYGNTRLRIGYKIYKKGRAVDVTVNLFPGEINQSVKLHLPTFGGEYVGEQIFGREGLFTDGRECVAHNFVAVKKDGKYLQIVTPSTYGSSYVEGEVRLTLHRGAAYCAHPVPDRPLFRENIYVKKIDQAQRDYCFRLDVSDEKSLQKNADLFTEKPYALNIFPTVDVKTDNGAEISTSNGEISVVTIKKGVQTDGYIFRLQNNGETENETDLRCCAAKLRLSFSAYEVKTVVYKDGKLTEIREMLI